MTEKYCREKMATEILSSLLSENSYVQKLLHINTGETLDSVEKNKKFIKRLAAYACYSADCLILILKRRNEMIHYSCATCGRSIGTYETYYRPHPQKIMKQKAHLVACSVNHSNRIEETYPRKGK